VSSEVYGPDHLNIEGVPDLLLSYFSSLKMGVCHRSLH